MIRINIHQAKTHLSRYLARVENGEVVVVCRRNVPIAQIQPLPQRPERRPIGQAKGEFEVTEEFFAPLPPQLLKAFEGKSD